MDVLQINEGLEAAQGILEKARVEMAGVNRPAWDKLYNAGVYLNKQQTKLIADALSDPEAA